MLKRPLRKSALLAVAILALVLGVAACGGDDDSAGESAAGQSEEVSPEGGGGGSITVDLAEQNGSGISGTATMTETMGTLDVFVTLDGDDGSSPRPIHIHAGTCEELGDVVYGLTDVTDGSASSTVEATLADLEGDFAVNAHESADAIQNYIACGPVN